MPSSTLRAWNGSHRRPDWLPWDASTSRFFHTKAGRMHFVDEGDGPALLFLHGNPTWSFLYRHLIRGLSPFYRCIAPDLLGFGLSDHPAGFSYRPADQAACLGELMDALGVGRVTLVAHDWGGPIGMAWALRQPERVQRLVLFNTWTGPLRGLRFAAVSRLLGSRWPGQALVCRHNLFARAVVPLSFGARPLRSDAHRAYLAPLSTPQARMGCWALARALTHEPAWLDALWQRRHRLGPRPALLLWGMRDPAFREEHLQRWLHLFPRAEVLRLPTVGHYVPEEAGASLVKPVAAFLRATDASQKR